MLAAIKSIFAPTKKDSQPYTVSLPDQTSENKEQDDTSLYVQDLIDQANREDQVDQKDNSINFMDHLAPGENRQLKKSMEKQMEIDLKKVRFNGLLVSSELQEFLNQNYFSRGRHNGVNFGEEGSFEFALKNITSDFEMILNKMIEARSCKINHLECEIESVPSDFEYMAKQLKGKRLLVNKEIDALKEQIKLANEEKGWISPSINSYKNGFFQGKQLKINYTF